METKFTQILKEFLVDNNLTQVQFAKKIGVRQGQVSEWLSGRSKPSYENLKSMSKAYNVSADYFLGITEED